MLLSEQRSVCRTSHSDNKGMGARAKKYLYCRDYLPLFPWIEAISATGPSVLSVLAENQHTRVNSLRAMHPFQYYLLLKPYQ